MVEKSKELFTLDIYGDHISINDQVIRDNEITIEARWESIDVTPYKKWIRVPTFTFYRTEPQTYMKSDENVDKQGENQRFALLKITTDIALIWMNIFIKYLKIIN